MDEINSGNWPRVLPGDPRRCQADDKFGQCNYKAKDGSKYCPRHNAAADVIAAKKAADRYRLTQYQERMSQFTTDSEIKNLRAEIGILRMTLEEIINQCHGQANQLVCYSGKISDIIVKIQKLVITCQRLDVSMGQMLDRDKVILIGQRIVEIISAKVQPDDLDEVSEQIILAIYEIAQTN